MLKVNQSTSRSISTNEWLIKLAKRWLDTTVAKSIRKKENIKVISNYLLYH